MIERAESRGRLEPGTTIVECTAGDTGVALAMLCAARGYRLVLTMPECTAGSRCNLLRALGAELVLTDSERGISGAMERAEQLVRERKPALILNPFANPANAACHAATTAREIREDTDGEVDVVVCPVGSGGTAAGCLSFFREIAPQVRIVAVEPANSAVLAGGKPGPHDLPGIGAGFVPDILAPAELDAIVGVREDDVCGAVRDLARREGILVGPASGAVLHAAKQLAQRPDSAGKLIVAILPDDGERHEEHACYAGFGG